MGVSKDQVDILARAVIPELADTQDGAVSQDIREPLDLLEHQGSQAGPASVVTVVGAAYPDTAVGLAFRATVVSPDTVGGVVFLDIRQPLDLLDHLVTQDGPASLDIRGGLAFQDTRELLVQPVQVLQLPLLTITLLQLFILSWLVQLVRAKHQKLMQAQHRSIMMQALVR